MQRRQRDQVVCSSGAARPAPLTLTALALAPRLPQVQGPSVSLYLTLFGILLGFLSTFWSFGYTRLSGRLRAFLDASSADTAPTVRRSDVINMLEKVGAAGGVGRHVVERAKRGCCL